MKNKVMGLVLVGMLSVGVVGCGNNEVEYQEPQAQQEQTVDEDLTPQYKEKSETYVIKDEIMFKTGKLFMLDEVMGDDLNFTEYGKLVSVMLYLTGENDANNITIEFTDKNVYIDADNDNYSDFKYGLLMYAIETTKEGKEKGDEYEASIMNKFYNLFIEVYEEYDGSYVSSDKYMTEIKNIINEFNLKLNKSNEKSEIKTYEENVIKEEPIQTENEPIIASIEQKQALKKAEQYINLMGFSKEGLKKQLEYEGFEDDSIKYAVENVDANWNEEALEKAEQYMDLMGFSKEGMRGQLEYEGFENSEIEYAINNLY